MQKVQWFACPGCDRTVTGMVRDLGPRNEHLISFTHCCKKCEAGCGHNDDWWCAGTPSSMMHSVELPGAERPAHYILWTPPGDKAPKPAPALLFLHGGLTYAWPETLHLEVDRVLQTNAAARSFVIIAPFATKGEPLALRSGYRRVKDRFENDVAYVDAFKPKLTWQCFVAACRKLGPELVDFSRLCITGFSMGAQATWMIAADNGSSLAAVAPMAGRMPWPDDAWANADQIAAQLQHLPIRAYSVDTDDTTYAKKDFHWMAERRGLPREHSFRMHSLAAEPGAELRIHSWGERLQLNLVQGYAEGHNCWDLVYRAEHSFGLFRWMAQCHNPQGALLLRSAPAAD